MDEFYKGRESYLEGRSVNPDLPNIAILPLIGRDAVTLNLNIANSLRLVDCVKLQGRDEFRTNSNRQIPRLENRIIDRGM